MQDAWARSWSKFSRTSWGRTTTSLLCLLSAGKQSTVSPTAYVLPSMPYLNYIGTAVLLTNPSFIQRLFINALEMREANFLQVVSRIPLLEDLTLRKTRVFIGPTSWDTFACTCSRLQRLSLQECSLIHPTPNIRALLALFPSLQTILVYHTCFVPPDGLQRFISFDPRAVEESSDHQQLSEYFQLKRVTSSGTQGLFAGRNPVHWSGIGQGRRPLSLIQRSPRKGIRQEPLP